MDLSEEVLKVYMVFILVIKVMVGEVLLKVDSRLNKVDKSKLPFVNRVLVSVIWNGYKMWSDDILKSNPSNQAHLVQVLRTKAAIPLALDPNLPQQKVQFQDVGLYTDLIDSTEFEVFMAKNKEGLFNLYDKVYEAFKDKFVSGYERYNEESKKKRLDKHKEVKETIKRKFNL